jgi:hypothetical protein
VYACACVSACGAARLCVCIAVGLWCGAAAQPLLGQGTEEARCCVRAVSCCAHVRVFLILQASRVVLRLSGGGARVTSMDDIHDGASYTIDVEGDTEADKERDGLGFT